MALNDTLSIDIARRGTIHIPAKQADHGYDIVCTILRNGENIVDSSTDTASFRVGKPDNTFYYGSATVNSDNTVSIHVDDEGQMLAVAGYVVVDITLNDGAGAVKSTQNFVLDVQAAPGGEAIPSSSVFIELEELVAEAEEAIPAVPAAVEAANAAAAAANTAAENANQAASHSVRYDTAQTLTTEQKAQARENIDGASVDDVNDLKSAIVEPVQNKIQWLYSTVSGSGYPAYQANRMVTAYLMPLGDISVDTGGNISSHLYDENFSYIGGYGGWSTKITKSQMLNARPTAKYMRVIFRRSNDAACDYSDISTYGVNISGDSVNQKITENNDGVGAYLITPLEIGTVNGNGIGAADPTRLRSPGFLPLEIGAVYKAYVDGGHNLSISFYPNKMLNTQRSSVIGWTKDAIFFRAVDNFARFIVAKTDNSTITQSDINLVTVEKIQSIPTDYLIAAGFNKIPVFPQQIGTLKGIQSFCKFEGKYYSTDGSNLYVQSDSFALESTTELSLGHGNAFQLGGNGVAYVSGWNDQKVYAVDLATKTVLSTITLPTTGYTTVAVDDVNQLMYIFQRDSTPTTEAIYNFIVYDYANAQIVSTKKTTVPFGGMQAVDFINGRIFVVNGLGTNGVPNGFRIYSTSGDIIAEYKFGAFSSKEPEGVFVDRNNGDIYLSLVDGTVFIVNS